MILDAAKNKVELLCKYKIKDSGKKDFSPEAIIDELQNLTDEEIKDFINQPDSDINFIDHEVYYYELDNSQVKTMKLSTKTEEYKALLSSLILLKKELKETESLITEEKIKNLQDTITKFNRDLKMCFK